MSRWVTFDCYGTLIDWNSGIGDVLEHLFGAERAPALLALPPARARGAGESYRSYAEVLSLTLERLAADAGLSIPEGDSGALAHSLPDWPPFREVPPAWPTPPPRLEHGDPLQHRSRPDQESQKALGVPIDVIVTAEDVHSTQAGAWTLGAFLRADGREGATRPRRRELHPRPAPARELGLKTVWINRLGEVADPEPERELPDLSTLPDTLDELVPA